MPKWTGKGKQSVEETSAPATLKADKETEKRSSNRLTKTIMNAVSSASAALTKDPYSEAIVKRNNEQETGITPTPEPPPTDINTQRSATRSLRPATPPTRISFTHEPSVATPTRRPINYTQIQQEDNLAAHFSAVQRAQLTLDQAITSLDKASRHEAMSLKNQIESIEEGARLKEEETNAEIERLRREKIDLQSQLDYLKSHIDKLRGDIVQMGNDLNPDYGEDYYTSGFDQLAAKIERWIATHPISSSVEASKDFVKSVWESLETNPAVTWKIANGKGPLVNAKIFKVWYQDPSTRLQLLRYFVSAFLFQEIFQPFVYGMEPPGSATIRLVSEEATRQFSRRLLIRQAVISAALRLCEPQAQSTTKNLITHLSRIIFVLLPNLKKDETDKIAGTWINAAVELKLKLSTAQPAYSCYWVGYEDHFKEPTMVASAGPFPQVGVGKLCLFPGLARTLESRSEMFNVVKASIALGQSSQGRGIFSLM